MIRGAGATLAGVAAVVLLAACGPGDRPAPQGSSQGTDQSAGSTQPQQDGTDQQGTTGQPADPQPGGTVDPSVVLQVEQAVREADRAVAEVDRQSSGD